MTRLAWRLPVLLKQDNLKGETKVAQRKNNPSSVQPAKKPEAKVLSLQAAAKARRVEDQKAREVVNAQIRAAGGKTAWEVGRELRKLRRAHLAKEHQTKSDAIAEASARKKAKK